MANRMDDERRHAFCPRCQVLPGRATSLVMGHGVRTIHYVCLTCYHEWQHADPIPANESSIFGRPTKD